MGFRARLFAASYDKQIRKTQEAGLLDMRRGLLAHASGRVLEVGGGTGLNLAHYGQAVTELTITEPEPAMLRRLERRASTERPSATVLRAPAEDLPFADQAFDVVVSTLVLCGVDDQPRAIREIRRVLRSGGRLLFLEHVRSTDPALERRQDRLNWFNRLVVCCDCNRPTVNTLEHGGFAISELAHVSLPKAPSFARPAVIGVAMKSRGTLEDTASESPSQMLVAET